MSIRSESPTPVFATLAGLWVGALVGALSANAMLGDEAGFGGAAGLIGAIPGAIVGGLGAGSAALRAARGGPLLKTAAAALVGLVLAAGAGAWGATEIWQRVNATRVLIHPAPICLRGETERQCLGRERLTRPAAVVVTDREDVDSGVAVTGAVVAGGIGASVSGAVAFGVTRRRRAT